MFIRSVVADVHSTMPWMETKEIIQYIFLFDLRFPLHIYFNDPPFDVLVNCISLNDQKQ